MACRRSLAVQRLVQESDLSRDVTVALDVIAFTLRVVDSAGAPVAWTLARANDPSSTFHFDAGEAWSEEDLKLSSDLVLRVASAAATHVVELLTWTG